MPKKFLRRNWDKYSRLGRGRKKKQKWRRPKGRHNKMREKRVGYPKTVSIGYKQKLEERGKINGRKAVVVNNAKELSALKENEIAIIGKIGRKKKIEIAKKALEMKIKILNLNAGKFLEKIEKEEKEKKEKKAMEKGKGKKAEIKETKKSKIEEVKKAEEKSTEEEKKIEEKK